MERKIWTTENNQQEQGKHSLVNGSEITDLPLVTQKSETINMSRHVKLSFMDRDNITVSLSALQNASRFPTLQRIFSQVENNDLAVWKDDNSVYLETQYRIFKHVLYRIVREDIPLDEVPGNDEKISRTEWMSELSHWGYTPSESTTSSSGGSYEGTSKKRKRSLSTDDHEAGACSYNSNRIQTGEEKYVRKGIKYFNIWRTENNFSKATWPGFICIDFPLDYTINFGDLPVQIGSWIQKNVRLYEREFQRIICCKQIFADYTEDIWFECKEPAYTYFDTKKKNEGFLEDRQGYIHVVMTF